MFRPVCLLLLLPMMLLACGDDDGADPRDAASADVRLPDATRPDAGGDPDTGATPDSGPADLGAPTDTGPASDTGSHDDAGTHGDAEPHPDMGPGTCEEAPVGPTRPVPVDCNACRPAGPGMIGGGLCAEDADCTEGDNGRCGYSRIGGQCSYDECFSDNDCRPDQLCACDGGFGGGNACIEAGCHTDGDCGGRGCAPSLGDCGHYFPPVGYYCHTAMDTCTVDADCAPGYCAYMPALGFWACSMAECVG